MKKLTTEQYKTFRTEGMHADAKIRAWMEVPKNKYYSVQTYPEKLAGNFYITPHLVREESKKKISKSDS